MSEKTKRQMSPEQVEAMRQALHALFAAGVNGGRGLTDAISMAEPFVNRELVERYKRAADKKAASMVLTDEQE